MLINPRNKKKNKNEKTEKQCVKYKKTTPGYPNFPF